MKYLVAFLLVLISKTILAQQTATQNSQKLTAIYDGGDIIIDYNPLLNSKADSIFIDVIRKGNDGEKLIRSNKKIAIGKNYKFADTTLRKIPGIYQYVVKAKIDSLVLDQESVWAHAYAPDVRPVVAVFKVINPKGTNHIILNWNIASNFWVRNIALKRSRKQNGNYETISNINPKDTLFIDKVNDANEPFFYRLDLTGFADDKVYSSASIFVIPQFAIIPKAVNNISAVQNNQSIVVRFTNDDEYARGFYVKKRKQNDGEFLNASPIIFKNNSKQYVWKDTLSSLIPTEMYQYVVVAESNSFDLSRNSDTATVAYSFAKLPIAPPTDVRILTVNDTTYNLAWSVDSLRMKEIAEYQVYVRHKNDTDFKIFTNGSILGSINYLQIPKPKDGDMYKVKSTSVAKESIFSLPVHYKNPFEKDFGPTYLKAAVYNNLLNIKWLKSETLKVKAYKLYKWDGKAFILIETIQPDKDMVATKNYIAGQLNLYQLRTVNSDNIESNGSKVLQMN